MSEKTNDDILLQTLNTFSNHFEHYNANNLINIINNILMEINHYQESQCVSVILNEIENAPDSTKYIHLQYQNDHYYKILFKRNIINKLKLLITYLKQELKEWENINEDENITNKNQLLIFYKLTLVNKPITEHIIKWLTNKLNNGSQRKKDYWYYFEIVLDLIAFINKINKIPIFISSKQITDDNIYYKYFEKYNYKYYTVELK